MAELCDCPRCQLKHGTRPPATVTLPLSVVDEVRRALEPFQYQAKLIDTEDAKHRKEGVRLDVAWFRFDGYITHIVLGDCRRAAAALVALAAAMEGGT